MDNFRKIIQPYNGKTYGGRGFKVYVKIEYENDRLSLTGVEGPLPSGNCLGSCGQIDTHYKHDDYTPAKGWSHETIDQLMFIWKLYHLNYMKSGCEHQRMAGITYDDEPKHICPICGYKIGSAWKHMKVPDDVLEILKGYPEAETKPAWV